MPSTDLWRAGLGLGEKVRLGFGAATFSGESPDASAQGSHGFGHCEPMALATGRGGAAFSHDARRPTLARRGSPDRVIMVIVCVLFIGSYYENIEKTLTVRRIA